MKQFILIAHDAKDPEAHNRRMACREEHLATIAKLRADGKMLLGCAITDDNDKMYGSVIVSNFSSRAEFDAWLKVEPYAVNKVWGDITVLNGKLAPTFQDLLTKAS
jgi:uncharacterized protein YciI